VATSSKKFTPAAVLTYSATKRHQDTIRRHYYRWRAEQGIPIRCDVPTCKFHTAPLEWNGRAFQPILDHVDGNRLDNRPKRLRLLCPLCDSQLPTRGGANRGRLSDVSSGGFGLRNARDGVDYTLPVEAAKALAQRSADAKRK
jgi:hypothetical protein